MVEDDFGGVASIRFPYLTEAGPDYGRLCRGCYVTYEHCKRGELPANELSRLAPSAPHADRPLFAEKSRLRSREGFLDDVMQCYGARCLTADGVEDSDGDSDGE